MGRREEMIRRTQQRVSDLIEGFDGYCDFFDGASLFTGPSLFFHFKTLKLLRAHCSAAGAIRESTRLVEFSELVASFKAAEEQIENLSSLTIWTLSPDQVGSASESIWGVISALRVGIGETKIVSGSKALHHVLPELVPPIDREYTIRFFFHSTNLYQGDRAAFLEMFPHFHRIAVECRHKIEPRLGRGMNTSPTKIIDNAIVGFVKRNLDAKEA
jgi:hypothetical protein